MNLNEFDRKFRRWRRIVIASAVVAAIIKLILIAAVIYLGFSAVDALSQ